MKKSVITYLKQKLTAPATALAVSGSFMFGCAGSDQVADNTGMNATGVVVTETEVAGSTTPDGTTVIVAETDVVADTTIMTPERQNVANTEYDEMFEDIENTKQYDVLTLAKMNPNLSTFVELVELSGLAASFSEADGITVFAPTNEAFNKLPKERLAQLIDEENRTELVKFIQMHTLPTEESSVAFENNQFIDRGEQEDISIETNINNTDILVGGAEIVKEDVEASNGILHVVNGIIEPTEEAGADID